MRVLAGAAGALLVALMLSEFFVTFMLPRRVRRDPRIARGLNRLLWRPWRAVARRLAPPSADTLLGLFGPLALIVQLVVWALGLMIGYSLIEWAVAGGPFWDRVLSSSGLFLSAGGLSGSKALRVIDLLEAATGVGVLFIVIGYLPSVYSAFSRRETAVSQLATRAGSPPAAATLLHRAAGRERWSELQQDLRAWEEWAAELMETHLSYPLLAYYRSQHVNQNWLAALTAMVDVAAFVKATLHDSVDAADITFRIGRHALADLALQFRLEPVSVDRLSDDDFAELFAIVDRSTAENVGSATAERRLDRLREEYEPNAQALADFLSLELPPWFHRDEGRHEARTPRAERGVGRDLVGSRTSSLRASQRRRTR
jgi:hypothetical protein